MTSRPCRILLPLVLAVGGGCAKHEATTPPSGPERLDPVATEGSALADVPGAPEGCVARLFVRAARSSCPASEQQPTDVSEGQVGDGAPPGTRCWLSCMGGDDWAMWGLSVSEPGFRGSMTCQVAGGGQMTFNVVDPSHGFSPSAGAAWLTHIGGDAYAMDMRSGRTIITANACPAGQPSRARGG